MFAHGTMGTVALLRMILNAFYIILHVGLLEFQCSLNSVLYAQLNGRSEQ